MTEPVLNEIAQAVDTLGQGSLGGLRRIEDHERLSKLEYIVADHHVDIQAIKSEVKLISESQQQMINHLKSIKYILLGLLAGVGMSSIGLEKTVSILKTLGTFLAL